MNSHSVYIDKKALMQVLGSMINKPLLLERTDKYAFHEEDFGENFYKIIYGTVTHLREQGLKQVSLIDIENYLVERPVLYQKYKDNKGPEYIQRITEVAELANFDHYYKRLKKMTLLRMYQKSGVDISWLCDPNLLNVQKKQEQENWLDNTSIIEISADIDKHLEGIKSEYLNSLSKTSIHASDQLQELLDSLDGNPEFGIPLQGAHLNSIVRGARLGKFYLLSAATGAGKTRLGAANACAFSIPTIYDSSKGAWVNTGVSEPTLFMATEQDYDEIQTIIVAYVADVDEEHILEGTCSTEEKERIREAVKIIREAPLWIEKLNNFSMEDIENAIRRHAIDNGVRYVVHDYMFTSMKIMSEVTSRSGIKLREDQVLLMMSIRFKEIALELDLYMQSATQLSADWEGKDTVNQNQLRGAKAIADKVDFGAILMPVTDNDLKFLDGILKSHPEWEPNRVYHVYKNRRGKHSSVKIWCDVDLGTGRMKTLFVTTNGYEMLQVNASRIEVFE